MRWRLKSPVSRFFAHPFVHQSIKVPCHWPLWGKPLVTGGFPSQRASDAKNGSIWWRHHVMTTRPESNHKCVRLTHLVSMHFFQKTKKTNKKTVAWRMGGDKPSTILRTTQFIGAFLNRRCRAKTSECNSRVSLQKPEVQLDVLQFHETVLGEMKIFCIPIDTIVFLGKHPGLVEDLWLLRACRFGQCKHATAPGVNLKSHRNVMYPCKEIRTIVYIWNSPFELYICHSQAFFD